MFLSVNDRRHLGYPAASSPKKMALYQETTSLDTTIGSAPVQPTDITRSSIWKVLALAKAEAVKKPEQH
jgi:hypothetical protein